jgi:hypothetical protein
LIFCLKSEAQALFHSLHRVLERYNIADDWYRYRQKALEKIAISRVSSTREQAEILQGSQY